VGDRLVGLIFYIHERSSSGKLRGETEERDEMTSLKKGASIEEKGRHERDPIGYWERLILGSL